MIRPDGGPAAEPEQDAPQATLGRFAQNVAVTLWPSFLAASVATMVFFAFLDPLLFEGATSSPAWLQSRLAGYTAGFFFFWAICTLSSALTLYLVRTAHPDPAEPRR